MVSAILREDETWLESFSLAGAFRKVALSQSSFFFPKWPFDTLWAPYLFSLEINCEDDELGIGEEEATTYEYLCESSCIHWESYAHASQRSVLTSKYQPAEAEIGNSS